MLCKLLQVNVKVCKIFIQRGKGMMQKVLIVGAGKGGTALLDVLLKTKTMHIEAVIDKNPEAPGLFIAQKTISKRRSIGRHTSQNRSISSLKRPETPAY